MNIWCYVDILRDLEFEVEDRVFLKLSPWKGVVRFGKRGKLNPRYIGPFEIVERIGPVAYRLDLPEEFSRVHNVFHISMLRKYIPDPSHALEALEIELRDDLSYEEQPVQILGREEKELRNKTISLVKALWRNHLVEVDSEAIKLQSHITEKIKYFPNELRTKEMIKKKLGC